MLIFDSHVHWFDLVENESWYEQWPPKVDKGLRDTHLPQKYYDEAQNLIRGSNHVQVISIIIRSCFF